MRDSLDQFKSGGEEKVQKIFCESGSSSYQKFWAHRKTCQRLFFFKKKGAHHQIVKENVSGYFLKKKNNNNNNKGAFRELNSGPLAP